MRYIEEILKYHRGEFNEEERQAFLNKCKKDPELAKEVKIFYISAEKHKSAKGKQMQQKHLERKKKRRLGLIILVMFFVLIPLFFVLKKLKINDGIDEVGQTQILPPNASDPIENNIKIEDSIDKVIKDTVGQKTVVPPVDNKIIIQNDIDSSKTAVPNVPIIFANLLPSNSSILEESIKIGNVMGSNWRLKIKDRKYEEALIELNEKLKKEDVLSDAEDVLLFHAGILELYENNNYSRATTLLSSISDDEEYLKQSRLHLFIVLIREGKDDEAKVFYLANKTVLDEYRIRNSFNVANIIDALMNQ